MLRENAEGSTWASIVALLAVTGLVITAADPSGLWGLLKEGMASSWALLQAKQDATTNALVRAVAEDFASGDGRSLVRDRLQAVTAGAQAGDLKRKAVDELRAVSSILDAKAPGDVPAFKAWLRDIAQKAAEAGTEGGFLGFGGVAVSDAEKATLADISAALSMPAAGHALPGKGRGRAAGGGCAGGNDSISLAGGGTHPVAVSSCTRRRGEPSSVVTRFLDLARQAPCGGR
jgi:hypothetical protein